MNEREQFTRYVLAGGDPKKWPWSSPDRAGTRDDKPEKLWGKLLNKLRGAQGSRVLSSDIGLIAQKDWQRIRRIEERMPNGTTRVRFENESGEDITKAIQAQYGEGHIFMRTKN